MRAESCPDADLLTAFAEDRVSGFVRESVTGHLAQCRRCSEICARLVNFDIGASSPPDADWTNAEKRLTNWMDGFLAGKRLPASAESVRAAGVPELPRAGFRWRMPWALGTAAALGVIVVAFVGGMLVANRGWRNPGPVQVATREPVAQIPNPVVTPAATPGTQSPAGGQESSKTSKTGVEQAQSGKSATAAQVTEMTGPSAVGSPKHTTTAARNSHAGAGVGVAANSSPRLATPSAAGAATTVAPNAAPTVAPVAPKPAGNSDQIAQQFSPPNLNPNDRIQAGTQAESSAGSPNTARKHLFKGYDVSLNSGTPARGATSTAGHAATTSAPAHLSSTVPLPAQLRIEANKRLWIRASLLNQNPDGSFTFSGTLLQPFDQGGVHLDSETRLEGAGLVKDGAVTISVNSVKYRGVFYFLQTVGDQSGDQKPGAGKALQFHDGQIIEMWFLAPSIYEKATTPAGDQPKQ